MQILDDFDPSATTTGKMVTRLSGCGVVYLLNESNISLTLTYQDGKTIGILPAWASRLFKIERPVSVIYWAQRNTLSFTGTQPWVSHVPNASGTPQFLVQGESYGEGEFIGGLYQGPLIRQTNIGNTVGTSQGAVSQVINDGNTAGTSVIEATVLSDSASAVQLTNDGVFTLGTAAHPGSFSTDNAKISSNGNGVLTLVNRILANLIQTITGNDFVIDVESGHKIAFQVNNTDIIDINSTTLNFIAQASAAITGQRNSVNGSVSGTATLEQILSGDFKLVVVKLANFSDAGAQNLAIPVTFTSSALFWVGDIITLAVLASGVTKNINVWSALALGGGASTAQAVINRRSIGDINVAFDTVQLGSGAAKTGTCLIIGF